MKEDAPDHRKMKRLARLLGIPLPYANGIMERLWHHTGKYVPDGGIGRLSDEDIAEACGMPIDTDCAEFVVALAGSGFLDPVDSCRYFVHDWPVHCTHFIHNRIARKKAYFANGQMPKLDRLDRRYKPEAEIFYGVSAQSDSVSAQSDSVSAQSDSVSAQSDSVSAHKKHAVSAQNGKLGAQSDPHARARPTPTPTPTPTPLDVLQNPHVKTSSSRSSGNGLMMNGAWKLTEAAVHQRFPSVNGNFWPRFLGKCGQEFQRHPNPKCGSFSDLLISEAVEQANRESPNQESAGLYLQTVPAIIATWARDGVSVAVTNKRPGFVEGVKKLARKKLERDGEL